MVVVSITSTRRSFIIVIYLTYFKLHLFTLLSYYANTLFSLLFSVDTESRNCDYPATFSTSNGYARCCIPNETCHFYTTCSGDTLFAAGTSVGCGDTPGGLTCNTGIVLPTIGMTEGAKYLDCWQTTLANPFTLAQVIGTAGKIYLLFQIPKNSFIDPFFL